METQINGNYISSHTGVQIDSVVRFFLENSEVLMNLPNYIKSLESQNKILSELNTKRVPELEAVIVDSFRRLKTNGQSGDYTYNDTLRIDGIEFTNNLAQIDCQNRIGVEQAQSAFSNSIIKMEAQKDYIPIYANKHASGLTSMGIWVGEKPKTSWYHNGLEQASLSSSGIWTTAAGNDFAEFRKGEEVEAGRVVCENGDGTVSRSYARLQPGALIVSDTYGSAIGQGHGDIPVAVAGRVLAHPYEDWWTFEPGDAVCAGPNGTVSKMSRREIRKYPERIIGTVSELPTYEKWNDIPVNGRIWITIK